MTEKFIVYERNENFYYLSETLKAGGGKVEGKLIKKCNTKLTIVKRKNQLFLERLVLIDYNMRKICYKKVEDDD